MNRGNRDAWVPRTGPHPARRRDRIAPGQTGLDVPLGPLLVVNVLLAAAYGVCMGFFGVFGREVPDGRFILADAVKVPLLFLLTLFVTFPSLYVFNALVGSRLGLLDLARLMACALGVLVAVLAAFGPIVAFFSVTTTSYPFIVLLNVAVFALAAGFAIVFLLRTVDRLTTPLVVAPPAAEVAELPPVVAALEGESPEARTSEDDHPQRRPRGPGSAPAGAGPEGAGGVPRVAGGVRAGRRR